MPIYYTRVRVKHVILKITTSRTNMHGRKKKKTLPRTEWPAENIWTTVLYYMVVETAKPHRTHRNIHVRSVDRIRKISSRRWSRRTDFDFFFPISHVQFSATRHSDYIIRSSHTTIAGGCRPCRYDIYIYILYENCYDMLPRTITTDGADCV